MTMTWNCFKSASELLAFVREHNIKKEDIQLIFRWENHHTRDRKFIERRRKE